MVFYPRQGLVYNRIKKSGNSSMLLYLRDAIAGVPANPLQPYHRAKDDAIAIGMNIRQVLKQPIELLRLQRCFYFAVMRHPEARILSAFLEKVGSGHSHRYSSAGGFGDASAEGFARFVAYLEAGGLHDDAHWWPQVDLLALPPDQYDAIYRLEELAQWLPALLGSRGLRTTGLDLSGPHRIERQFSVPGKPAKLKGAASRLDVFFTPGLRARVNRLYGQDYQIGGYPWPASTAGPLA
ncbi:sulfotransferase family protein [Cyanobium sp. ATX 6F1]|uniref:sulfotransferase family protein n=1 Tax=unclassified Cyanobium TaxID=2627006 RepID=UPI0020CD8E49|nr:sulfotransferase family protein [Cyanobium sp. ATX 6F1]MCP9916699.1 sulfotransferase family 2 domain-containing protein [Cyanobium sp. ATX 6F1]